MRRMHTLGLGVLLSAVLGMPGTAQTTINIDPLAPPPPSTPWDSTGWQGRIVVGEYITGIFCGPCSYHERAFKSLLRRYPAKAFVALAYHGADNLPLAIVADSLWQRLYHWYGLPSLRTGGIIPQQPFWDNWIDGQGTKNGEYAEDGHDVAPEQYASMVAAIDAELRKAPDAVLHVRAEPQGGKLVTTVRVDSIRGTHPSLYLRLVLVEDTITFVPVRHPDMRVSYYMVVRDVARAKDLPLGLPLSGAGETRYTFDVAAQQRRLLAYHALGKGVSTDAPIGDGEDATRKWASAKFPNERDWHIDPTRLHVVAFVQDAKTGEVLQTQMVKVYAGPDGKKLALR